MKRNSSIEGIRGVLMIWIVLYHYTSQYNNAGLGHETCYPLEFSTGGIYGVFSFFLLSGYFANINVGTESGGGRSGALFFVNRYWRLWPAYAIACCVIFLFLKFFPLPTFNKDIGTLIVNVLTIVHPTIDHIDGAHWFIKTLVEVYLLMGIALCIKNRNKRNMTIIIALLLVAMLKFGNAYLPIIIQGETRQFADGYMAIMLGYYIKRLESHEKWIFLVIIGILTYFVLITYEYVILALLLMVVLNLSEHRTSKTILGNPFFVFIGKYSFCWYLLHQLIGFSITYYVIPNGTTNFFWILIPMVITFIMAIGLQLVVNKLPKKILN